MTASSHTELPLERVSFFKRISPVRLQVTSTSASGLPLTDSNSESTKFMLGLKRALNLPMYALLGAKRLVAVALLLGFVPD